MTVTTDRSFSIRWGRTLVALVGLLALLTAGVTGVLAAAGPLLTAVPLTALGVFVLSLATLRSMAVVRRRRARRKRVDAAMREAMYPQADAARKAAAVPGPTAPFDALSSDVHGAGGPNSLQQLDEDGLPVEVERTFTDAAAEAPAVVQPAAQSYGTWEPREVPKPKYLEAEKAERTLPEPFPAEEPKRPSSEVKLSPSAQAAPPQRKEVDQRAAENNTPEKTAVKNRSMDLDEVLKRRRA